MLIILAGITLNAVIGENGIIFQAKDTKNLVDNETKYDNQQLASLQNELKDNQLYSGIGIIPGTDQGGSSEGSENGSSGTNQGGGQGNNQGGGITGENAQKPEIVVVAGESIAASFYQTDVTVQISTPDRTQKIKYILNTDVAAITEQLYPSGLVRELDIENGGTLTFTKDGEYTITAYAYDTQGKKSNASVLWFKRQSSGTTTGGLNITKVSGNQGNNEWYITNVTLRILGTNSGSKDITYRVQGRVTGTGYIGEEEIKEIGEIDTGEVPIGNGTTFRITADGSYTITAYDYDTAGARISSTSFLLNKDSTRPKIRSFTGEQKVGEGFQVTIDAEDEGAGLVTNAYKYNYRISETNGEYISETSGSKTKTYAKLQQNKTYDMYVEVTDQAGNRAVTDVIVKPSLYISNSPTAGETSSEGARSYYRSNVTMTLRGQDSNNADISKTTYQIIGTVTEAETNGGSGSINGTSTQNGTVLPANEIEIGDKTTKTIQLQANGNWTVKVRNYNKEGKLVTTNVYEVTRDTVKPIITTFEITSSTERIGVKVTANDVTSGLASKNDAYQYFEGTNSKSVQSSNNYSYIDVPSMPTLKVVVKDKAGATSEETLRPTIYYLIDKVSVGDYVAYNAGTWSSTVGTPSSTGQFGGYTSGQNKGTSVKSDSGGYIAPTNGWRVFKKSGSGSSGSAMLISAGTPAQALYESSSSYRGTMINALNSFCHNNFVNDSYAMSARSMKASSTSSKDKWDGDLSGLDRNSDLININSSYWLATAFSGSEESGWYSLRIITNNGQPFAHYGTPHGVRPIVTLKSGVKTNDTKDTSFLGQTCWAVK